MMESEAPIPVQKQHEDDHLTEALPTVIDVRNMGEPIRLTSVNIHAVTAEAARGGDQVQAWTRMSATSDQAIFHQIVPNLISVIDHSARQDGQFVGLTRAHTILLVMRPDNSGDLWIDTAAVSMQSRLKWTAKSGTVLFENDIADITGMWFPLADIHAEDRILCIFREGWRFALFFDFNPDGVLSIRDAERDLGTLYRRLKYGELYAAVANDGAFTRLIESGWFPFIEIVSGEFKALVKTCEAGFELDGAEAELVKKFTDERVERMFDRWVSNPYFKAKEPILRSAVNAYKSNDAVATLKIVLSEIEGILGDAHFGATGTRTRQIKKLIAFTVKIAEQKAGGDDTLFLPTAFAKYLGAYTYADFDQTKGTGSAGSRHAVGHGAATAESYTITRALQALLTLDQLAFYI